MVSVWFVICLVMLVMLFTDQSFAQATDVPFLNLRRREAATILI
jgi:hypothetical protein